MQCIGISSDNTLYAVDGESCAYVLLEQANYQSFVDGSALTIDSELYTTVSGWILFSFVSGHVLGRILKGFGKG
ncbi:hypothetical protein QWY97_18675 [Vibrio cortegadensis]|uniref:hypothetical protein n=1 Tax=Vibrio cortegadensis TaxID=1328770 RepID=UPI0021C47226|nr:hypothetical protein [Vibrio cortegadensis]MDN3699347.1 hypothetical protein [Vibrio cortegadensis]